ncbi:MAG: hypothetical protein J6A09_01985, partial [Alphaproteobacteria bacterium]|nr:hypothetical protein [Alphaproteobacteria bacterium]
NIEKEYVKRLNEAIGNLENSVITYNQRVDSDNPKYTAYKGLEKMPGLKKFSPNVLMALIELSYNSGNLAGWKYLFDALAREDFQKAADESHRDDNHDKNDNIKKRNAWVYSKILSAAKKKELDK